MAAWSQALLEWSTLDQLHKPSRNDLEVPCRHRWAVLGRPGVSALCLPGPTGNWSLAVDYLFGAESLSDCCNGVL